MKKIHLLLAFLLLTVFSFGQLSVTVPTFTAMPGQTVSIPVKIYGAGNAGVPISSANIHVTYDTAVLTYDTIINFYSGTPSAQWYFSGNFNPSQPCNAFTASANWVEPALGTLAIPDGTTLYAMQFIYKGGNTALNFCINEFTDASFEFIPASVINGGVNAPSLAGPQIVCQGSAGNIYTTDAGQSNYQWTVTGGTITSGGGTADNAATVTWTSAGSKSVSVAYNGTTEVTLPVVVNANVNVGVSIAASGNPTLTGSTVTFTATPVNGGPTPTYQWKVNGSNAGNSTPVYSYVPSNGDVVYCLLTTSLTCVNNMIATSNLVTMIVNNPVGTPIIVTLPELTAMPGDILYFPVKLKGASSSGEPISSANIQIAYDPAVLQYDTLVNFHSAMPSSQWFFSGNNNTVAANWIEPALLTLAIPDSTTLFEIKFTYLGGTGSLPFTVNEFTDAAFEFLPASHYDGGVRQSVPANTTVQNVVVSNTQDTCFNATQIITVAGSGTTFSLANGGSATFVAGQMIRFLNGTTVVPGGYLHGYITPDEQYCGQVRNPVVIATILKGETSLEPEMSKSRIIRAYPNPADGIVTVEVKGDSQAMMTHAEFYSVSGVKVYSVALANERKHEFQVSTLRPGIYFVHVFTNQHSEILKIVKL